MNVTFQELEDWPGEETAQRRPSPYTVGWRDTIKLIKRELKYLSAKHVIVKLNIKESRIRNDGWPRTDLRVTDPKVLIEFETPDGWMICPCDEFTDWAGNIRAIALSLHDLRMAGSRGMRMQNKQYDQFRKELPSNRPDPAGNDAAFSEAESVLADLARKERVSFKHHPRLIDVYFRAAAMLHHPDTRYGDAGKFRAAKQARDQLKEMV